jgi:hypothetical protein
MLEAELQLPPALPLAAQPWRDVKDFLWHKTQQSPHWSMLPAAERATALAVEGHPEVTVAAPAEAAAAAAAAAATDGA